MIEILIITTIVVIFFVLISQNLSSTKFSKAEKLAKEGKDASAIEILESIFEKHENAPAKIAEIRFNQGKKVQTSNKNAAIDIFNEIIMLKGRMPQNANLELYEFQSAKAYLEISNITFESIVKNKTSKDFENKIKQNIQYIDKAVKRSIEADFSKLRLKHISLLAEVYYGYGVDFEKKSKFNDAIDYYKNSLEYSKQSSNITIENKAICRIQICKLKNNENIEISTFTAIYKAPIELQNDFFYRYVKKLLLRNEIDDAKEIIDKRLDKRRKEVRLLNDYIKSKQQQIAIQQIEEINRSLDNLYKESFPITEVKNLYDSLDQVIEFVNLYLPEAAIKIQELKPSLFNRLLSYYINNNQFVNAFNLIYKFPVFWESPELLKNLGICCYNITDQGKLSEKNYKTLISSWLTAVFSDKVIINSLEESQWDDNYTFTLIDSIGSNYDIYGDLSENVNNDDVSETNISIGQIQRELL